MSDSTPGNAASETPRCSATEWAVLDTLRAHLYDTRDRGSKPDDPGWHVCSCGWEGYWCDWQPHVAERITEGLVRALRDAVDALPCGAHAVCVCRWHRDDKGLIRRAQVLALLEALDA